MSDNTAKPNPPVMSADEADAIVRTFIAQRDTYEELQTAVKACHAATAALTELST